MRKHQKRIVLIAVAGAAFGYSLVPRALAEGPAVARTVELIADKDNKFKLAGGQKGPLTLKSGDVVKFRVTSFFGGEKAKDGALHSFVVRKLRDNDPAWSIRLKEGVQEFTVTAPKPGNYLIECTVECGPGHDNMNLKMVVVK
jgi:plastocyanin